MSEISTPKQVSNRRVTIKDIAADCNASYALINRALNNKSGVSAEMKEKILESAERLGYKVNKVAQSMARGCINIGIVIPSEWQEYYGRLKKGINSEYKILIDYNVSCKYYIVDKIHSSRKTANILEQCIKDNMRGIILCDIYPYGLDEIFEKLRQENISIVLIGGIKTLCEKYLCSIQIDAYTSGCIAAELLGMYSTKNSDVAIFVGNKDNDEHKSKIDGFTYEAALQNLNIIGVYETQDNPIIAYQLSKIILEENENLGGIYSATANSAPVCKAIEESGRKLKMVATDVSKENVKYLKSGVTQSIIHQDLEHHGRKALRVIYEYLAENKIPETTIYITPQIVLKSNVSSYYDINYTE